MELSSLDFLKQQDLPAGALYMVATPIGNLHFMFSILLMVLPVKTPDIARPCFNILVFIKNAWPYMNTTKLLVHRL
jgi:hypothetical protein